MVARHGDRAAVRGQFHDGLDLAAAASAALALCVTALAASPAGASSPSAPSGNASCVGQIFVPQVLDDPAAFVARIAEIKTFAPSFGAAIGGAQGGPGLAHWECQPQ